MSTFGNRLFQKALHLSFCFWLVLKDSVITHPLTNTTQTVSQSTETRAIYTIFFEGWSDVEIVVVDPFSAELDKLNFNAHLQTLANEMVILIC